MQIVVEPLAGGSIILLGLLGSLAAGLMTSVGALAVLVGRQPSECARDVLLGFAAGVMISASFFSLIVQRLPPTNVAVGGFIPIAFRGGLRRRYLPRIARGNRAQAGRA